MSGTFRFELFSLKRAQELVPLLRDKLVELRLLTRKQQALRLRIEIVRKFKGENYEVERLQLELKNINLRIQELKEDIESNGIIIRSISEGLVEFPTIYNKQPAYFSWRFDEPRIIYWRPAKPGAHRYQISEP